MSINLLVEYFRDKHKEILGYPYMISYGKDNNIMKSIGTIYGNKKVIDLIDLFFEQMRTDEFLQKTGATIGVFKVKIPKLLLQVSNGENKQGTGKW